MLLPFALLLWVLSDAPGVAPPAPGAPCPSALLSIGLRSRTIDWCVLILLNCGLEAVCVDSIESLDSVDEPESECESASAGEEKDP